MTDRADEVIRSNDNRTLKFIRSLRLRTMRETERAFVVEGVRAVEDALDAGGIARIVLLREGADWTPGSAGAAVRKVASPLFDALSETITPQPVMAVFEMPVFSLPETVDPLLLLIDGVRDPGNIGTLLRGAAGAGVSAAFLTHGTVDPFNGKAVRAGMGAQFRLPIDKLDDGNQNWLRGRCDRYVLADARAAQAYDEFDWRGAVTLIVGSEADGPSELGRSMATDSVRIPLRNGVESLNASVAGSILLFEAARQRGF